MAPLLIVALLQEPDNALVLATWAALPPYCRYCHASDHALVDCPTRKRNVTYRLCGEPGHYRKQFPRHNDGLENAGKKRKVSSGKAPSSTGSRKESSRPSALSTDNGQRPNPPAVLVAKFTNAALPAALSAPAVTVPPASVAASGTLASSVLSDAPQPSALSSTPVSSAVPTVPNVPAIQAVPALPVSKSSTPF
ncbi:hypothetical protein [Parasitella parasitica]|uniref:CCHC-type domain-containing protein n=1 Tax=Parasitella parasitica TaxID=35722 RepID=A0A0B7NA70_9FUNG|nr:hypothetical protein [Parasitella parasitica]